MQDVSTSPWVTGFTTVSHSFRMELFFLLAGFFARNAVQRRGAQFLRTRLIRVGIPFLIGWFLRPLLVSGWIVGSMSLRGTVDVPGALWGGVLSLSTLPTGLYTGTHLWFLYYLALITGLTLGVRWLMSGTAADLDAWMRQADAAMAWIAGRRDRSYGRRSRRRCCWGSCRAGVWTHRIVPLRPHLPVLLLYGGCFGLGWMLGRQRDLLPRFAKSPRCGSFSRAWGLLPSCGSATWARSGPSPISGRACRVRHGIRLTLWSLVFLTLGIFGSGAHVQMPRFAMWPIPRTGCT